MRADNLLCLRRKAFVPATTDSRHGWRVVPNLARGLMPTGLDRLWVADITCVHLAEAFACLAIAARRPVPGSLIHHSDRGVQYACGDYAARLEAHDIQPSMSRVGNPYDNAKAERFMRTLKEEEVDGSACRDAEHARAEIGQFIETVYNRQRLHSALDYLTPEEYEATLPPSHQGRAPDAMTSTNETCPCF